MIKEWLPHLLVGLVALSAGAFGSWLLSSDDAEWQQAQNHLLGGFSHQEPGGVVEAHLPPRGLVGFATFSFTVIGGFYLAAAIAGWVHRT